MIMFKMPSHQQLRKMIELTRAIVFPDYFEYQGIPTLELQSILTSELHTVLPEVQVENVVKCFMDELPEICRLIHTDVQATKNNDPAAASIAEVVLCYPLTQVMLYHRVAHSLLVKNVPLIPRMLSEIAHSDTGIDIHPAAQIGAYFCIDHGTGVVIGATTIIGTHVVLYQGVTLGARNFQYDAEGLPVDQPRHPIIEDNVTVYSNASILGRIRIGHDSIIGGNVWLTHEVPPHSRVLQQKTIDQ